MKRSYLYLGILLLMLTAAQSYQLRFGKKSQEQYDAQQISTTLKHKFNLINLWEHNTMEYGGYFTTLENDIYILIDTVQNSIQCLKVVESSLGNKEDIFLESTELSYDEEDRLSFTSANLIGQLQEDLEIAGPPINKRLTKEEFKRMVEDAHYVDALVGEYYYREDLDWRFKLNWSPYLYLILLGLFTIILLTIDVVASWIASFFDVPIWKVFAIPLLVFLVWDCYNWGSLHYNSLKSNGLAWSHWLTARIALNVFLFLGFLLFFKLKKGFFDKMNFADAEAGKFVFIFVSFAIVTFFQILLNVQVYSFIPGGGFFSFDWLMLTAPVIMGLLVATVNFLNNLRKRFISLKRTEHALGLAQQGQLKSQAELTALQSKVNPHFLYNSLNSIASLAKQDPAKTEEMTLALSKFYRYSANRKDKLWSTIEEEIELIENYLEIEKIRFGEQLKFEIDCRADLKQMNIPNFLLQPLVENAIKYGYNQSEEKIDVGIQIRKSGEDVVIKILDTGAPFSEDMQLGYGLESVQQKLKLCYPDRHQIDFVSSPQKGIVITLNG